MLLFLVAAPTAYADGNTTVQTAVAAKATAEQANCLAQAKCATDTPLPTGTPTPSTTPTLTPQPTGTPTPPDPPTATVTPTATPGPPCWTDANGDKWLIVDGGLYFDDDGEPVACPSLADLNATPEATPVPEPPAPFVQPTAIFVPPTPIVITQVIERVVYIQSQAAEPTPPEPTPVPDTPTPPPTWTPRPTDTPWPTAAAILAWTDTPTPAPTATATSFATPTRTPPPVAAQVPRETPSAPPGPPGPPAPPWVFAWTGAVTSDRQLWPVHAELALLPPSSTPRDAEWRPIPPSLEPSGWLDLPDSPWVFMGAKGYTRFEAARP